MQNAIRNFVIIAHIDHGKSTLADRLLEVTGTVPMRSMHPQYLDALELERERGITIKMAPVRMKYAPQNTADNTQNNAEKEFLYEEITYKIRGAAFEVRKFLGLGHKEVVYHNALAQELTKKRLRFESEKSVEIFYDGKKVGSYQPDFVIEDKIIVELKALPELGRPQTEQLWSYLKGSHYKLALLINFGTKDIEIKRVVYDTARPRTSAPTGSASPSAMSALSPRTSAPTGSASPSAMSALSPRTSAQIEDEYILNLIDTPGHSDFGYEVSRALTAVEGAVLLVDATQGIQAQTLANFEHAKRAGLTIIGAVNKIDVAAPEQVASAREELADLLGVAPADILGVSGKTGAGVEFLLKAIIEKIPPPQNHAELSRPDAEEGSARSAPGPRPPAPFERAPFSASSASILRSSAVSRALVFDSQYDEHRGVIAYVRVFSGAFRMLDHEEAPYYLAATHGSFKPKEIGYFAPQLKSCAELREGEIGYVATGIKDPDQLKIGDTIANIPEAAALPGFKIPKPVVFVSFYPAENDDYDHLKAALGKLRLNDSSLAFLPDKNEVLGRGFKGGFLGRLHFEITAERIAREFGIETVHSFPSVEYRVKTVSGWQYINNPKDFPDDNLGVEEPVCATEVLLPSEYLGPVLQLTQLFRFRDIETKNFGSRIIVAAKLPLADLIQDLDDQLKSVTQGFASLSYELTGYEPAVVKKMDILVAENPVAGLTRILPAKDIEREARKTVERLKELLPRQQFVQALQAIVAGRIIARETIPALKKELGNFGKNGGDRTRKMKLWKKQQRGKERLKERAESSNIRIPAYIFKELLKK